MDNNCIDSHGHQQLKHTLRKIAHAMKRKKLVVELKILLGYFFKYIFLIFAQNIDYGYTLEPPRRGCSNEYPQSMFWSKIRKIGIPLHTLVLLYKRGHGHFLMHVAIDLA